MMKRNLMTAIAAALLTFACTGGSGVEEYRSAVTGEVCEPDLATFMPADAPQRGNGNGNGGHNSPTGLPGDNIDDEHSGKVDCYWDGDSGQGNDQGECTPPAGCDANGCCIDGDDGGGEDVDDGGDFDDGDGDGTGSDDGAGGDDDGSDGSGDGSDGSDGDDGGDAGTPTSPDPDGEDDGGEFDDGDGDTTAPGSDIL